MLGLFKLRGSKSRPTSPAVTTKPTAPTKSAAVAPLTLPLEPPPVTATASDDDDLSAIPNGENVNVYVRVRPLNHIERQSQQSVAWNINQGTLTLANTHAQSQLPPFNFDTVFHPTVDNATVFDTMCQPLLESCMAGYHTCLFAYGQTSSGKTHTIHGHGDDPGCIPLTIEWIFSYIEQCLNREFVLRVSYMEIYNEIINDLLTPLGTNLQIREDKTRGVFCDKLTEEVVISPEQVYALLTAGEAHRHVGKTNYNEQSSRSHTIFRLIIESTPTTNTSTTTTKGSKNNTITRSVLNLVDLAGSENAVKAGNSSRIKETGFINRSLLTLGHVIFKLSEPKTASGHIPYRDSKLTRLLQNSLSGHAKVAIIAAMSPSSGNIDETISTLKFASRAKKMQSQAEINDINDESSLLRKYREEIERLKCELISLKESITLNNNNTQEIKQTPEKQNKSNNNNNNINDNNEAALFEKSQMEQSQLSAQIEHLTRLILTSSSTQDSQQHPPNKAHHLMTTSGRRRTMNKYGTLKGPILAPKTNIITGDTQLHSPSHSQKRQQAAFFSTNSHTNINSSVPSSPRGRADNNNNNNNNNTSHADNDLSTLTQAELITMVNSLQAERNDLRTRVNESEARESEWREFAVVITNRHNAVQSHIRAITESHSVRLNNEIEHQRRTGSVLDGNENVLMEGKKLMDELAQMLKSNDETSLFDTTTTTTAK